MSSAPPPLPLAFVKVVFFKSVSAANFQSSAVAGIIALAEVVAESKTILRVDLRDNDPYVGGLMALSLSLKVNKSLVRIDLDKDLKKEPVSLLYQRADVR